MDTTFVGNERHKHFQSGVSMHLNGQKERGLTKEKMERPTSWRKKELGMTRACAVVAGDGTTRGSPVRPSNRGMNTLNEQLRTANKERSSSLGVGRGALNP